ncbi:MAG TPA: hypothetical protein VLJ80_09345 [Solirubrobacteraceae bacterium]|nr:hypothetical protein [Solirubrobacteraceae bacterium]
MASPRSAIDWESRDLRVAPLSRRFVALLINLVFGLVVLAAGMGMILALVSLWQRRSSDGQSPGPADDGGVLLRVATGGDPPGVQTTGATADARGLATRLQSRPVKLGLRLLSFLLATCGKERRGPGYRALGLRLADRRSGGELSPSQQIVRATTREIWRSVHRRLVPPPAPAPGTAPDHAKLRAEIESARCRHEGEPEALQLELARIFRENRTDPVSVSCLPLLARLPLIVAAELPMPWSPLEQSLVDWLSGTVVVLDRTQTAGRSAGRR